MKLLHPRQMLSRIVLDESSSLVAISRHDRRVVMLAGSPVHQIAVEAAGGVVNDDEERLCVVHFGSSVEASGAASSGNVSLRFASAAASVF